MLKRFGPVFAGVALAAALSGCASRQKENPGDAGPPPAAPFEIGIMTGTESQGDEDYRAAEQVAARYGRRVKHITFPDNFPVESTTVVAQLAGLAADPDVRVIVVGQAIPGSVAAARRIRETRPDIRIGFVDPHEPPDSVGQACDIAIEPDQIRRGVTIIEAARKMGARNFVHYSFPRHMSQVLLARRRDIMRRECEKRGLGFHFVAAPDPTEEGGLRAAQKFILEDVPRQLEKLGSRTAFFATSDGVQEPLIRAILEHGGYFVEQDVPAPTAGYPAALGIKLPREIASDMDSVNAMNRRAIAARDMSGHFGTWIAPVDMVAICALTSLLVDAVDGKADLRDSTTVLEYLKAETASPVKIRRYDPSGNHWMMMLDRVTY